MAVRMFAAIDVGSFALELGIYEISDKTGIRNVEHIRHVIALGSDTFSEGKISYDLVDEMCRVLEKFTETMKMYRVKDYRAYATTAMREAEKQPDHPGPDPGAHRAGSAHYQQLGTALYQLQGRCLQRR